MRCPKAEMALFSRWSFVSTQMLITPARGKLLFSLHPLPSYRCHASSQSLCIHKALQPTPSINPPSPQSQRHHSFNSISIPSNNSANHTLSIALHSTYPLYPSMPLRNGAGNGNILVPYQSSMPPLSFSFAQLSWPRRLIVHAMHFL